MTDYYLDFSKELRKSVVLWKIEGNVWTPVVYFQKPANMDQQEFQTLLKNLILQ